MSDFHIVPTAIARSGLAARRPPGADTLPAAPRLLPKRLRPHIAAFHRFVRLAGEVADDTDLEPETKLAYLDALERTLTTGQAKHAYLRPAVELRNSLLATGIHDRHARQILRAFRRDAVGARCHTWSDLLLYCRFSANPVGRYLLDLHGEGAAAGPASDALCSAVQILHQLQNGREDWVALGRCYLPLSWFEEAGISIERMVEDRTDAKLRGIFDRLLDHTDRLLVRAAALPTLVSHRGLRVEAAMVLSHAEVLSRRLRAGDPMQRRIGLWLHHRAIATVHGMVRSLSIR